MNRKTVLNRTPITWAVRATPDSWVLTKLKVSVEHRTPRDSTQDAGVVVLTSYVDDMGSRF